MDGAVAFVCAAGTCSAARDPAALAQQLRR